MGNTKRTERKSLQVYFTLEEAEQLKAILGGENFNRWVREKVAEQAKAKGLPFENNLPQAGGKRDKKA